MSTSTSQTLQSVQVRPWWVKKRWLILFLWPFLTWVVGVIVPPPTAVARTSELHNAAELHFLVDDSYVSPAGERVLEQEIFDELFDMIQNASSLIVLDMFLFNDWQGPVRETHRLLADDLTNVLVAKRKRNPDIAIIVITDPINTVYGGLLSRHLEALKDVNIEVVMTDLTKMQDSNPLWSSIWRWLIRPFGNQPGTLLANPFGDGQVSLRSYLALFNFKANHRKLLVADNAKGQLTGFVSSANPHDGSSAHRNIAVSFTGPAVVDLLDSERLLLQMSGADSAIALIDRAQSALGGDRVSTGETDNASVQIISESRIRDAVLDAVKQTVANDRIDMAMFYLSHREIVRALAEAASRGVAVRVLLDVNQDAFGRRKNGVPNRPVAAELVAAGVEVRWCKTLGEQCHAKWLHTETGAADPETHEHRFFIGSANFTRRNLDDFNLETDVLLALKGEHSLTTEMIDFFDRQWENRDQRSYSADYAEFADDGMLLRWQYRFMEATGLSTF